MQPLTMNVAIIISISILLFLIYAFHKARVDSSEVIVPDMSYLEELEKHSSEIDEMRIGIGETVGTLKARVNSLENTVETLDPETGNPRHAHVSLNFLQARDAAERSAKARLHHRAPQ
ncbi:hypothetical protein [Nocardiopsis sp. MG754419]|uniref:hypothetical protein n=1 Tax=Nocardiopsis sp. MG754419 TaxID=2259865 RepID=UPI001BA8CE75|nr:hypothetical protein [Nocardiopsis sp. MG754419]